MKITVLTLAVSCMGLLITGCMGNNFVHMPSDSLVLGQTTPEQIIARLGRPEKKYTNQNNQHQTATISYIFAGMADAPDAINVYAARSQSFSFFNNKLVSYLHISSYKKDSTNFDITKSSEIVKGVSTQADVLRLMGEPAGKAIYPITQTPDDEQFIYIYTRAERVMFKGTVTNTKLVTVTFNRQGMVTNVQSRESSDR